jgi:tetratricopeptide (TPR) repeat protein
VVYGVAACPASPALKASLNAYLFPNSAILLGQAYILAGQPAATQPLLERAIEQIGMLGDAMVRGAAVLGLGEAHLLAGDRDAAQALASEGLALSQAQEARGGEARAWRLLGEIAAETEPPGWEDAENHYRQALADELGMHPLVANCYLGLGTLYQRVGRDEQAHAELTTAAQRYRAMGMVYWLEKAEAALAGARTQ